MDSGLLLLKWNNHQTAFLSALCSIKEKDTYSDATLACDGKLYPVHKLILSTCSEYFQNIFHKTQCKHPVIVLKDIASEDLEPLLNYMYIGEVNVLQDRLSDLIKAAECLRIKGLAMSDDSHVPWSDSESYTYGEKRSMSSSSPDPKKRRVAPEFEKQSSQTKKILRQENGNSEMSRSEKSDSSSVSKLPISSCHSLLEGNFGTFEDSPQNERSVSMCKDVGSDSQSSRSARNPLALLPDDTFNVKPEASGAHAKQDESMSPFLCKSEIGIPEDDSYPNQPFPLSSPPLSQETLWDDSRLSGLESLDTSVTVDEDDEPKTSLGEGPPEWLGFYLHGKSADEIISSLDAVKLRVCPFCEHSKNCAL